MTTTADRLKAFQELNKRNRFSANARSLYLELVWTFEGEGDELKLGNRLLQERSGIQSSRSFDAARSALINAGLIKHKNQVYSLVEKTSETERKSGGKAVENSADGFIVEQTNLNSNLNKKNKTATTTTTACACEATIDGGDEKPTGQTTLSRNSPAVEKEWFMWNNAHLKGGDALELIQLENLYGTEKVVAAIHAAGCADKYGKITMNFLKKVLARIVNGETVKPKFAKTAEKKSVYDGDDDF